MPARFRDIIRVVTELGVDVIPPKNGSHWKLSRPGSRRPYVITAHNGPKSEIPDKYIRAMCRNLELAEADVFAALGIGTSRKKR